MTAKTNQGEYVMCRRKNKYTARRAYRAANRINRARGTSAHIYRCPICGQFHIGRNKFKERSYEKKRI